MLLTRLNILSHIFYEQRERFARPHTSSLARKIITRVSTMATEDSRGEAPASQEPLDAPNSSTSIIAGSSHHEYELVPTTETSTTGNHDTAVPDDGSDLPKVSEGVADRQDAGLLTRSRFHWSVLVPLDVLLALSPIFFFGKTPK